MVPSILKDHTEHAKDWNPSTESFFEIANLDDFWTTEVKRCFSIFPFTRVEVKTTVGKAASLNSEQDTAENHPCTHSTFRIEPLPFFISLFLTQQSDGDWMQTYSGKHDLSNQPTWTWMRSTQMRLYIQLCNLWHLLAVQPAIFFFVSTDFNPWRTETHRKSILITQRKTERRHLISAELWRFDFVDNLCCFNLQGPHNRERRARKWSNVLNLN